MKIYNNNITYDFCATHCIKCKHNLGLGVCPIFKYTRYYEGKRIYPIEQLDVFEL